MKTGRIPCIAGLWLTAIILSALLPLAMITEATGGLNEQFIEAVRTGGLEQIKTLLDQGADANESYQEGSTALMWATIPGQVEVVRLLLDRGADVNAKAKDGSIASHAGTHQEARQQLAMQAIQHG